jgi:hypothetical protein
VARQSLVFSGSRLWNTQLSTDLTKKVTRLEIPVYSFHGLYDYAIFYQLAKAAPSGSLSRPTSSKASRTHAWSDSVALDGRIGWRQCPGRPRLGRRILDSREMVMSTESDARVPKYLGAAFIFQFATSLTAGLLSKSILAGSPSEVLTNISGNLGQTRASLVLFLLTSVGIIVMTSLLYVVLGDQNRAVARVALGLWMAEAVMLAVKTLGIYALVDLSAGPVDAGTPASYRETLGSLSLDFSQHAGQVDMLFFCFGALLWYSVLLRSRIVPRLLPLWGLVAVPLVLVATVLLVWDNSRDLGFALYALYIPFELVLGLWLLIKGASVSSPHLDSAAAPEMLRGGATRESAD